MRACIDLSETEHYGFASRRSVTFPQISEVLQMRKILLPAFALMMLAVAVSAQKITQGGLEAVDASGKTRGAFPLKHTDVKAEISGFLSRVKVTQEFENSFSERIEAVYVFPLPNNAAVDSMTMRIGERVVRGKIMKREEARQVYDAARQNGQIASLLDQERTNIFTQSVANILPGERVTIEITYVETLKYEDGSYEFVFPMVVGPRYIPGAPVAGGGTTQVPDAGKITPPIAETRAGQDISIEVALDAGVPVESVESKTHAVDSAMLSANSYSVKLRNQNTIPNKDFILRYDVTGKRIADAVLTHRGEKGGYFSLILQPPDSPRVEDVTPKEIVFVVDTSGSMSGFPIEKAKESMRMTIEGLNPQDTFNLITFAGDTSILFDKPVPASPDNISKAKAFLESRQGYGGTEMMKAIKAALEPTDSQQHVRIVCFMTDGYIGNEAAILEEIQKHKNARIFSFGIGSSVNRMLLDKMAEEGRGEVEYVGLQDDGSKAAKRFYERVRSPLLTDIEVDFGGLPVADVYPKRIGDLFSAKPVIVHGRYTAAGRGVIRLRGKTAGRETIREIPVDFPAADARHDVLATLWARTRIDDLTRQDYSNSKPEIREQITSLGLEFGLMTQFTSFVAVEERIVTDGGAPVRIDVPVDLPEGVTFQENESGETERLKLPAKRYFDKNRAVLSKPTSEPKLTDRKVDVADALTIDGYVADEGVIRTVKQETDIDKDRGNGAVVYLADPKFEPTLAWDGTDGAVEVRVVIDKSGKVIEAKAEKGHAALRKAAEAGALKSRLVLREKGADQPTLTGIIEYSVTKNGKKLEAAKAIRDLAVKLTPEEEARNRLRLKTATTVFDLAERVRVGGKPGASEAKFVRDEKADVLIRLRDLKPETVAELAKLGVVTLTEVKSVNGVVARVPVANIAAVGALEAVTFVSPQNR